MRRTVMVVALAATVCPALSAQRLGPPVKRPRLEVAADTNDAKSYYDFGVDKFERNPEEASAAFYWAARINPGLGEPLYARRAALIMMDKRLLRGVMEGDRRTLDSKELRSVDSLQFRALMLSPFLYRKLDRRMFLVYFRNSITDGRGDAPPDLDYAISVYLNGAGYEMRAWLAYSDGDFDRALRLYASALSGSKDKSSVHLDRARIFGLRNMVDSATAEFKNSLDEMRKKDQKDLVVFYNSKALAEYSIAVLLEGAGNIAGAREAYGQALTEDLSYYPAHMRLGLVALGLKDTTSAMSELALASQLAPDEPHIRFVNGVVLAACGHFAEAAAELQKSIALEPYYAIPYLRLGQVSEQLGKGKEAADAYDGFLKRAALNDLQRPFAQEHLTEIKETMAALQAIAKP
jgi:tetratricopeptide (TPR) repeat protein